MGGDDTRRRPTRLLLCCAVLMLFVVSGVAAGDDATLPNLVPRHPNFIQIGSADDDDIEGIALRFGVQTANDGAYPLDVLGVPDPNDSSVIEAQQCVQWIVRVCTQREDVGTLVWHQAHEHWHFNDFAIYELRKLDPSGQPDMSPGGLVSGGQKTSFCLEDTASDSSEGLFEAPLYRQCAPVRQGISAHWYDEYPWHLPGQEIPIVGVPDGAYAIVITVNSAHLIRETNYGDNTNFERITLSRDDKGLHVRCESPINCELDEGLGEDA
jgi:hypothetical protein